MKFWNLIFNRASKLEKPKVKKTILFEGITIKLYEIDWYASLYSRNIGAYDQNENKLWIVEKPTQSFHYWDMQIDETAAELDVEGGNGFHYTISIKDGRIISSRLIK